MTPGLKPFTLKKSTKESIHSCFQKVHMFTPDRDKRKANLADLFCLSQDKETARQRDQERETERLRLEASRAPNRSFRYNNLSGQKILTASEIRVYIWRNLTFRSPEKLNSCVFGEAYKSFKSSKKGQLAFSVSSSEIGA